MTLKEARSHFGKRAKRLAQCLKQMSLSTSEARIMVEPCFGRETGRKYKAAYLIRVAIVHGIRRPYIFTAIKMST